MEILEALEASLDGCSDAARVTLSAGDIRRAIVEIETLRAHKDRSDAALTTLVKVFNRLRNKRVSAHDLMEWRNGPLSSAVSAFPGVTMT